MATGLHRTRAGRGLPDPDDDPDVLAVHLIERLEGNIRLALPLGLGKPVTLVNALTRAVAQRPDTRLSILTALTLEAPDMRGDMQRRFLQPAADRLFGAYPGLDYARMEHDGTLPANIEIADFFFLAGRWLGNGPAQRRYIAANYTHALDLLCDWGPNLVMQLLAEQDGHLSLSCNTDISVDLLERRRAGEQDFLFVGEINRELPFFGPPAEIARDELAHLHDGEGFELFSAVKRPAGQAEHAIGLHVARLIPDGGTLQIGIGAIGDAVAHALILRHRGEIAPLIDNCPFAPDRFAETGPFRQGLYGVTEMLVDGLLQLFEAGIVTREIEGHAIDAGFFVDCRAFYRRLRDMPADQRARIAMRPVSFTNALYGDEAGKRAARVDARFVNAAMKATLLGGLVSDATEEGQEVSGVGGQFNFIEQAFALRDARAIITLPATRKSGGRLTSNIVWDHPHETIPRPYRDVVVTEYGIADLRGRRDEDAVAAMLAIADSRFQPDLLKAAKRAGKIAADYEIPPEARSNTPKALADWLKPHALPVFPFGTDFDAVEQRLLPALSLLGDAQGRKRDLAALLVSGLTAPRDRAALARMGLDAPSGLTERMTALALSAALHKSTDQSAPE